MNSTIIPKLFIISEETASGTPTILSSNPISTRVKAILQTADTWNRNRRNYSKKGLDNGIRRENVVELMLRKSWCGEAGHPYKPDFVRQVTINPQLISHRIEHVDWRNNELWGIVETLNTDHGRNMKGVIDQGLESAYSLRAVAPFRETPQGQIVEEPINVITYDWVILPSHKEAYQSEILESYISDTWDKGNRIISEGCVFIPAHEISNESAIQYIKDESRLFKLATEQLEFNGEAILSEDSRNIILTRDNQKLVMSVEDYIRRDITSFFNKLK